MVPRSVLGQQWWSHESTRNALTARTRLPARIVRCCIEHGLWGDWLQYTWNLSVTCSPFPVNL